MKSYFGNIVDVINNRIFSGEIQVENGIITRIIENTESYENYIVPGFIDAHVHVESSMLVPSEFAKIAVQHGTVATVSDPHEIANVCGIEGVRYMIENAKTVPFKFYFSAPSCVPATTFETAGATIDSNGIEELFAKFPEIKYLGEMMNFPGVIFDDSEVMKKIDIAKKYGKRIDGHSPGLRGENLKKYVSAGITTDHECFTYDEAMEKLSLGMKILIREGSAVQNFDELIPIAKDNYDNCMFCTDDKHPDDLVKTHINDLVRRAVEYGLEPMKALQIACVNPVNHYGLEVGMLQVDDLADFTMINNLKEFKIIQTVINGNSVFENGETQFTADKAPIINNFDTELKEVEDFKVMETSDKINIIEAIEGQLITKRLISETELKIEAGNLVSDIDSDTLKIAVINRYSNSKPAVAFIRNFGLKAGAIASSVAHDSHNVIVVGTNDKDICEAANLVIKSKGGVSAYSSEYGVSEVLALPVGGIMSNENYQEVADKYTKIDLKAKELGSTLRAPYMTLSFMALLVIPEIKLSDLGLFDGNAFKFIELGV